MQSSNQALLDVVEAAGPVVLLAVGAQAQRSGWAAQTAVELADELSRRGRQVVLVDLSLQQPELHTVVGVDNDEGLSDVFLFGASLPHITHSVTGKKFRFIAASPYTPDPQAIL